MTARIQQSGVGFLASGDADALIQQSGVAFLVMTFPLASPTRIQQSGIAFLTRRFPRYGILRVAPPSNLTGPSNLTEPEYADTEFLPR